jgi:hypothetical protein
VWPSAALPWASRDAAESRIKWAQRRAGRATIVGVLVPRLPDGIANEFVSAEPSIQLLHLRHA